MSHNATDISHLEIYLVGGAVRDQLLGIAVKERDWVVVGASEDQMLSLGFRKVGKDFPVFLHPESGEEYALARTERKSGEGHKGFVVHADPSVTLEQDLKRRDLTINAIAQAPNGNLIDPFNGLKDITTRKLRHVSAAFPEDPLRVLRVARFKARLHHLGFNITPDTATLLKNMSTSGELDTLVAERVWREIERALSENSPQEFVKVLYQCEALAVLIPELDSIFHRINNIRGAQEQISQRVYAALSYAASHGFVSEVRFAILLHALDTPSTPSNLDLKRLTTKNIQTQLLDRACERIKAPNKYIELARLTNTFTHFALKANSAKPDGILDLMDSCDVWRRPERFELFLQACESLSAPDQDFQANPSSLALLRTAANACKNIVAEEFIAAGIEGPAVGESIRNARKTAVASIKKQFA